MKLKPLIKSLVGQELIGRVEYFFRPKLAKVEGPFNGQKVRRKIFFELANQFSFDAIVETGTFRGYTTTLFADLGIPVYTIEAHPRYFGYVKSRFRKRSDTVHLMEGDSRDCLRRLLKRDFFLKSNVFFYLDAHWKQDLPLREEVDIVFTKSAAPVVMIDDFEVPGTTYGFDDYGAGKALTMEYLNPVVSKHGLSWYYPSAAPSNETGHKRGSVVLCREAASRTIDLRIESLR